MMKYGILSDHFEGVGAKYLTEVEVNRFLSNQHEFQGVGAFREILGLLLKVCNFLQHFIGWTMMRITSQPLSIRSAHGMMHGGINQTAALSIAFTTLLILKRLCKGYMLVIC